MIRHVVLLRFLDPSNTSQARDRLLALPPLIPAVRSMEVLVDVLRTEASYDLCLLTTHDSLEALTDYAEHPAHQSFLAWVRPLLADRAVVDASD